MNMDPSADAGNLDSLERIASEAKTLISELQAKKENVVTKVGFHTVDVVLNLSLIANTVYVEKAEEADVIGLVHEHFELYNHFLLEYAEVLVEGVCKEPDDVATSKQLFFEFVKTQFEKPKYLLSIFASSNICMGCF